MPPLTDSTISSLKPPEKALKHFDGGGLYLLVQPNGARLWRMKYRVDGREKLLCFGPTCRSGARVSVAMKRGD